MFTTSTTAMVYLLMRGCRNENRSWFSTFIGVTLSKRPKQRAPGHTQKPFVDMKRVTVEGGNGGDGCIAFDRLFCNPNGGPSGGSGGHGGHVIFQANSSVVDFSNLHTLLKGDNGIRGSGSNCHGANAKHCVVQVPLTTQIHLLQKSDDPGEGEDIVSTHRNDTSSLLGVLKEEGETLIGARGGSGGRGNAFLASSNHLRLDPSSVQLARDGLLRLAERGAVGQKRRLILRIPNFADIGLVGAPNAGKSTLLRRLTRARPRVAPYPFTTLAPHTGVLELPSNNDEFTRLTVADLPGLIEGAATRNAGLGAQFLSLIEGCSLLVYIVDVGSQFVYQSYPNYEDLSANFHAQLAMLHHELEVFNPQLTISKHLVLGTKMDLLPRGEEEKVKHSLMHAATESGVGNRVLLISALRGDSIDQLMTHLTVIYEQSAK